MWKSALSDVRQHEPYFPGRDSGCAGSVHTVLVSTDISPTRNSELGVPSAAGLLPLRLSVPFPLDLGSLLPNWSHPTHPRLRPCRWGSVKRAVYRLIFGETHDPFERSAQPLGTDRTVGGRQSRTPGGSALRECGEPERKGQRWPHWRQVGGEVRAGSETSQGRKT